VNLIRKKLKSTPPSQARAQQTLHRIVAAAERLLQNQSFEELTIADLVREAQTTTGSFYARFASKEALLPYLYEIYDARGAEAVGKSLPLDTSRSGLPDLVRELVSLISRGVGGVRWLLRAMAIYARTHPDRLPPSAFERSRQIYAMSSKLLTPRLNHCPARVADIRARFTTYAVITLTREHQLFGDTPLAAALGLDRKTFESELARMATAYLAS
jgi:AcrR family transcriptional regulator